VQILDAEKDYKRMMKIESQGKDKNSKVSRITLETYLRIPLPCILIGSVLGGIIGGILGDAINGIRVGIILGGVVAFIVLHRKNRNVN